MLVFLLIVRAMREMQAFINKAQFIRFVARRQWDRRLNKGGLFNSRNPSERRDEMKEIEERYTYIPCISCRFRQTTVEYEILSLMLPATTIDYDRAFVHSICLSSIHAKQIHLWERLLGMGENLISPDERTAQCKDLRWKRKMQDAWS